jgi:hypothetical protein
LQVEGWKVVVRPGEGETWEGLVPDLAGPTNCVGADAHEGLGYHMSRKKPPIVELERCRNITFNVKPATFQLFNLPTC